MAKTMAYTNNCIQFTQYCFKAKDLKRHQIYNFGICGRCMTNEIPELEYCLAAGYLDGPGFAKVWEKLHCSYLDS